MVSQFIFVSPGERALSFYLVMPSLIATIKSAIADFFVQTNSSKVVLSTASTELSQAFLANDRAEIKLISALNLFMTELMC